MNKIHPLAEISEKAVICDSVTIWRWTYVGGSAYIGSDTSVGQCCCIEGEVGQRCRIQNNVNIFDGVKIGHDVFIGPSVTFTNVKMPRQGERQKHMITVVEDSVIIGAKLNHTAWSYNWERSIHWSWKCSD